MFARRRRDIPELNTTSTADISFMLLIFFLVTSSMDTDKGLARQLPPPDNPMEEQDLVVKRRNVMQLHLDAQNRLTCNGEPITAADLTLSVADFVDNTAQDPEKPEMSQREVHLLGKCLVSDRHVIFIEVDPQATYDAYFAMQNAIVAGYARLRGALAQQRFGHPWEQCSLEERDAISMVFPQRISEREQEQEGGEG
ncbi:MAG: biopolymer transporter ExbD [Prevotella sp.]|nr:biopolymer transporter ExbD [Prevotella sp.]